MAGYIKLHRGWRDTDGLMPSKEFSDFEAWLWILENAAWKEGHRFNAKGELVPIERGQMHVSIRALQTVFGWSKARVERFLGRLKTVAKVTLEAGQSGTILTVCNYEKYQGDADSHKPSLETAASPDRGQPRDTHKEGKKGKEEKNSADALCPDDVSEEVWADFCRMRKAQKAPVTDTAVKGIRGQAVRAGWSLEDALAECVARGWRGFKADWVKVAHHGRDDEMTMPC
jgi:hypothetical protein